MTSDGKYSEARKPRCFQSGNVVEAEFRRHEALEIEIAAHVLYQDNEVLLIRTTFSMDGREIAPPTHLMVEVSQ